MARNILLTLVAISFVNAFDLPAFSEPRGRTLLLERALRAGDNLPTRQFNTASGFRADSLPNQPGGRTVEVDFETVELWSKRSHPSKTTTLDESSLKPYQYRWPASDSDLTLLRRTLNDPSGNKLLEPQSRGRNTGDGSTEHYFDTVTKINANDDLRYKKDQGWQKITRSTPKDEFGRRYEVHYQYKKSGDNAGTIADLKFLDNIERSIYYKSIQKR